MGTGAATTLAVVEASGSTLRSYHIGDAEILLTGQRGKLKFKTIAHSPVGYAVEAGLLENEEALLHEDRHIVSNCVGVEDMHIDMGPVLPFARYDTLLIASDGVFDNLMQDQLIEIIRKGPLRKVSESLLKTCRDSMRGESASHPGKPDDLSFILLRRN
jgi:serine/threonine protein phosphatase PrpC